MGAFPTGESGAPAGPRSASSQQKVGLPVVVAAVRAFLQPEANAHSTTATLAGAAGSLPFRTPLSSRHVIITGEIRHHDALTIGRYGCSAIALGHWASERPVLKLLAQRLAELLPNLSLMVSKTDRDPFDSVG
jgi:putative NIF3 family GTP cyclohydrolase 1 type 2